MDLWTQIEADMATLQERVGELRTRGYEKAVADAEYRKAKALAILEARADGQPAAIAKDVVYERPDMYRALLKRDSAETMYASCFEEINALKLQIRICEAQLEREWGQAKRS